MHSLFIRLVSISGFFCGFFFFFFFLVMKMSHKKKYCFLSPVHWSLPAFCILYIHIFNTWSHHKMSTAGNLDQRDRAGGEQDNLLPSRQCCGRPCTERWDGSWQQSCSNPAPAAPAQPRGAAPNPRPGFFWAWSRKGRQGEERLWDGGPWLRPVLRSRSERRTHIPVPGRLWADQWGAAVCGGPVGGQQHARSPGSGTQPPSELACVSKGRKLWQAASGSSSTAPQHFPCSYGSRSSLANDGNLGSVAISFLNCAGSKLVFGLLTYKFSQLARRARCFCEWKNCIYLFAFSKSLKPHLCR